MKRPGIFNKTLVLAFAVFLTVFCGVLPCAADDVCPDVPTCGGESLEYFITDHYTGAPISDGAVLPVGATVHLDAYATAYGQCQTWIPNFPDFPSQCILGDLFQRPVDHVSYRVYAATEGPLNGDYYLGGSEEAGFFEMNLVDEAHEFFVSASLVAPDTPTLVILTLPTITPAFKVKTSFTRIQENLLSFL